MNPLIFIWIALVITLVAGFLTHLWWVVWTIFAPAGVVTLKTIAIAGFGTFVPPLGAVHGIAIWFGWSL